MHRLSHTQLKACTSLLGLLPCCQVTPARVLAMDVAIKQRNFPAFAELVMAESNSLQAVLDDTLPPVEGQNDVSRRCCNHTPG